MTDLLNGEMDGWMDELSKSIEEDEIVQERFLGKKPLSYNYELTD